MTVANISANKISPIPRQCHPAAIAQMVMDGLRCPLGDATQSSHACSYYVHSKVQQFSVTGISGAMPSTATALPLFIATAPLCQCV